MSFNLSGIHDDAEFLAAFNKQADIENPLTTSDSAAGESALGVTTYTVQDILQGATAFKPPGVTANAYNQLMTSELQRVSTKGGDQINAVLKNRGDFLPPDLMNKSFIGLNGAALPAGTAPAGSAPTGTDSLPPGKYSDFDDTTGVTNWRTDAGPGGVTLSLGTYRGTEVNKLVIASWKAMVDKAATQGLDIHGGGYRSNIEQIQLRKAHCPDWENSPASACSPPTARPGKSNHEKGLAVDIDNCSRGSAIFNWLVANAASFGWINLPSESWHWSINGQ
jgi:hypothetical protein